MNMRWYDRAIVVTLTSLFALVTVYVLILTEVIR